jgi:hypothetical protein
MKKDWLTRAQTVSSLGGLFVVWLELIKLNKNLDLLVPSFQKVFRIISTTFWVWLWDIGDSVYKTLFLFSQAIDQMPADTFMWFPGGRVRWQVIEYKLSLLQTRVECTESIYSCFMLLTVVIYSKVAKTIETSYNSMTQLVNLSIINFVLCVFLFKDSIANIFCWFTSIVQQQHACLNEAYLNIFCP